MADLRLGTECWINEYISPYDYYAHGVTKLLAYKRTEFQEMYIIESGVLGKGLVLDGKWQSCTGDEFLYHEPLVHPAMIAHGSPRSVLILGGGEGATAREVLRWKEVERVCTVDIDGEVLEACRQHLPEMHQGAFDDPRSEVIIDDALDVLDRAADQWDVVISDLSDPIEEGPSFKLFTKEYFERVRQVLSPKGVFVLQAGPVSPAELPRHARLVRTVKSVFEHVHTLTSHVPSYGAPWGFALASSIPIDTKPDVEQVDRILENKTRGGYRMLDGTALLGMYQIPVHMRRAIQNETTIFTLKEPPRFFGKGVAGPAAARV